MCCLSEKTSNLISRTRNRLFTEKLHDQLEVQMLTATVLDSCHCVTGVRINITIFIATTKLPSPNKACTLNNLAESIRQYRTASISLILHAYTNYKCILSCYDKNIYLLLSILFVIHLPLKYCLLFCYERTTYH